MKTLPLPTSTVRLAGLFYLVIILCGVGAEVALRGPLIDGTSASATVASISAKTMQFRLSIMADVVMAMADASLAVLLFLLFRTVSPGVALAAMVFRLIQTAVIAVSLLNLQMALFFIGSGDELTNGAELALHFVTLHAYGYDLGLIFFGVNSLLTALLILWSGFLPKALGIGIGLSGGIYIAGSFVRFLVPELTPAIAPAYVVPLVAESALCLWLIVLPGHRNQRSSAV